MTEPTAAPSPGTTFDPNEYPRRYRARLILLMPISIALPVLDFQFISLAIQAILKPAPPVFLVGFVVLSVISILLVIWLLNALWRGTLILRSDHLIYGSWPQEHRIRRDQIEGFRVSNKPSQMLVLIPKGELRKAVTIPIRQLRTDKAFWRWFETLDGLGPYDPAPRSQH